MSINDSSSVFDRIASGWYGFRHHTIFGSELTELALRWKNGKLLNIGCGHGPDFLPFKNGFELHGIDMSSEMLKYGDKFARKYGFSPDLRQADMRALPYPEAYFDCAITIASLHHIEGTNERLRAMLELKRVLKPGAEAFITVWNANQPRFLFRRRDRMVPWRIKDGIVQRFYHLFTYGEMERLAKSAGFTILSARPESRYHWPLKYFSRNICLLVKKCSSAVV